MSLLVLFVVPFYRESTGHYLRPIINLPGVQLAVISQDPAEKFPEDIRYSTPIQTIREFNSIPCLLEGARTLVQHFGPPHRILAINEQVQLPVAELREYFGVEGMSPKIISGFRDKGKMKEAFRAANVPCARHVAAKSHEEAHAFVREVGYPVCVKPLDGAAAQATFKVKNPDMLEEILHASAPTPQRPIQVEEFVVGEEFSFETLSVNGHHLWHSITHYDPTPLNVVRNPWIQWNIVSPRNLDDPVYDDIKEAGCRALSCLGMKTGLTHLEWFRRTDGSVAINEVAARPPGAEIDTIINRAHDIDMFTIWAKMMIWDHIEAIPVRKYASGAAFLRGLGGSVVKSVEGLEVLDELGDMLTDASLPYPGQAASSSYEGEGFIIVRHPDTDTVKQALRKITDRVRVRML